MSAWSRPSRPPSAATPSATARAWSPRPRRCSPSAGRGGVPDIAARAGVGKATVYRSFPTKEHLIAAVVVERLTDFEQRVRAQFDAPDAVAGAR